MKLAGITQIGQKRLIFIVVSRLRIGDDAGFFKKRIVKYIKDTTNNNDNIAEALNNHSDNRTCLLV